MVSDRGYSACLFFLVTYNTESNLKSRIQTTMCIPESSDIPKS